MEIIELIRHALMVTGFVAAMMILVEYINVFTLGRLKSGLGKSRLLQYCIAALLGTIPGCLGAFTLVTMYTHRLVSIGAVVACMIATSGDEAFVMLGLVPETALLLFGGLFALGIAAGALTDIAFPAKAARETGYCHELNVHEEYAFRILPNRETLKEIRNLSPARGIPGFVLFLYALAVATGQIGHDAPMWVTVTILTVCALTLFVLATVSDHFIEEHVWEHVVKSHLPRLFFWAVVVIGGVHLLEHGLDFDNVVRSNVWLVLLFAALLGLLPESGPHLVFVTLFASGSIPLSVLVTSSIVQDGHGMLPLLASSRRDFIKVKAINFLVGVLVGATMLALGT